MKPVAKAAEAFRTISEVSDELDVPKHVLRFWEMKFTQIKPMKRGGGRRYYRPQDVELLRGIHSLLHSAGYTIRGVQKILREQGVDAVKHHADAAGAAAPKARTEVVAAPVSPDLAPPMRRGRPPAATSNDVPARTRRAAIATVISELEACLALLRQEPRPVADRKTGAARS